MTDARKSSLAAVTSKLEDLRRELEALAAEEYEERDLYPDNTAEYDVLQWNGSSLEDAATCIIDAMCEIADAVA